jgi:hypothetical protein
MAREEYFSPIDSVTLVLARSESSLVDAPMAYPHFIGRLHVVSSK